jgi:hypothetical protein
MNISLSKMNDPSCRTKTTGSETINPCCPMRDAPDKLSRRGYRMLHALGRMDQAACDPGDRNE